METVELIRTHGFDARIQNDDGTADLTILMKPVCGAFEEFCSKFEVAAGPRRGLLSTLFGPSQPPSRPSVPTPTTREQNRNR